MAPQTRSITRRTNRPLNPGLAISKSTRPYKCCVCRHSFGRTETLNYHWLYSHPGRPLGMPAFVDPSCWGAGNVIENKKWRIWWKWWMADEEVLTRLVEEGEDVLKVMGDAGSENKAQGLMLSRPPLRRATIPLSNVRGDILSWPMPPSTSSS